jgi:hypothetical protein
MTPPATIRKLYDRGWHTRAAFMRAITFAAGPGLFLGRSWRQVQESTFSWKKNQKLLAL